MTDLAVGFATMISGSKIATYRADGSAYLASETAIVFKDMPASPDRVVCITPVPMTDQTVIPLGMVLVQVKTRGLPGRPLDVDDLGDAIFDLVHGARNTVMGSTTVVQILRNSSVPMGVDAAKRWERVDHYYCDVDFAATLNRPDGGWD